MPRKIMKFLLIAIVAITSSSASAQSRQADLSAGGEVLEPNPDGTYFLPVPGMESMTLRFEPGEMPIELVALRIDEDGDSLVADLRYTGEQTVTAWKVKLASLGPDGREGGAVIKGSDWGATGDPRLAPPPGYRVLGPVTDSGPIRPGDVRSVDIGSASGPDLREAILSVPLLVFEDTSYLGSARDARDVLENRAMEAEETARWIERLSEALESTSSERELSRALEEVIAEIEATPDIPLRPGPNSVRHGLEINLKNIADPDRSARTHVTKREQVRELVRGDRIRLEAMIEHVPETIPPDDGPPRKLIRKNIEEGPGGDPSGDTDLDCDCGGSISYSHSSIDSRNCDGSPQGWRVDERWNYTCRNESGQGLHSDTEELFGVGACIEDQFCFSDTYCPPVFDGPIIEEIDGMRILTRSATDYRVEVGFCGFPATCQSSGSTRLMTIQCQCSPMPRPRCFADGCPILIETGAGGFKLTDAADGVDFDLVGHGVPSRVAWTEPGGDDAWLVLDRNGNGRIDDATELFGDRTPQPPAEVRHGFLALAVFDEPAHGGDSDGWISAEDSVFDALRLWLDHDHDGVSDLGELIPLASADVEAIELDFFQSGRRDRHGNRFRYSARVRLASGGHRLATDVFLQFE